MMMQASLLLAVMLAAAMAAAGCAASTGTSAPVVIDYPGEPGWVPYTNNELGISISAPRDWDIVSVPKATLATKTSMDLSRALNRFVFICTGDLTECVMVSGMNYSDDAAPLPADPATARISDERYREILANAKSSTVQGMNVAIEGIEEDSRHYTLNGHPARHAVFTVKVNGQSQSSDCYIVGQGRTYYTLWYAVRPGSSGANRETATGIMHTFDITG